MKDAFPYESCFKELSEGREAEPEDPDYHRLLESLLGRIYLWGNEDAARIVSCLERNVRQPHLYQRDKDLKKPLHTPLSPHISQAKKEERIFDNSSNNMATDRGAACSSSQPIGSTLSFPSKIPSQEVGNGNRMQLQGYANLTCLASYTTIFEEYGAKKGTKPLYTCYQTKVTPASRFLCTVTFEGVEVVGLECSSKQNAKHEASKALWEKLQLRN